MDEGVKPLAASGYTMVAIGGVGLVVGAVLQGMAGAAQGDGEETDSYVAFKDDKARMESLQTGAIVSFAVGGALAVTGAVMLIVKGRGDKRERAGSGVSLGAFPGGAAVGGRF
jgi:hypothetical protein